MPIKRFAAIMGNQFLMDRKFRHRAPNVEHIADISRCGQNGKVPAEGTDLAAVAYSDPQAQSFLSDGTLRAFHRL